MVSHNSISLLALFLSMLSLSPASSLYEDNLERVHFQPRARDVQYLPLHHISALNYSSVTEVYTKTLETIQLVSSLKNKMGQRLNETVPPPHRHCFISERNFTHLHTLNHNSTQALRCDQYMLANFPSALRRATLYETRRFGRQEAEVKVMEKVEVMLENIQLALENFTGLVLNETTEMGRQDVEACGRYEVTTSTESDEERTGQQRSRESGTPPSRSGNGEEESTGNQRPRLNFPALPPNADPTDIDFFPTVPRRNDMEESDPEDATPTAVTPTRCTDIQHDSDQFVYITELWVALYYLKLDLQQKRNCLSMDL